MLSIIVAVAENNIIGGNNKLLWHIPEDLKRFKEITSGNTIYVWLPSSYTNFGIQSTSFDDAPTFIS